MDDVIRFTYNWNNKLAGTYFTTIRLKDVRKFQVGRTYRVELRKGKEGAKFLCYATIEDIREISIEGINNYIAGLDTGYSAFECKQMLRTMYKNIVKDWTNQRLFFILLKREKQTQPQNQELVHDTAASY